MANYKYSIGLSFIIYVLIIGYLHQCLATSPKSSSTQNTNAIRDDQMISNSTYIDSLIMHQTARNNLKESSVPENRILNGQPATVGQFPYQVIVYVSNLNVCGGAVLNKNTIITAAQCLYYPDKNQLIPENEIKVGAGDVNSNEVNMKHFTVKSVHPHEMYNQKTFKNDLAIIKINEIFWDESPTPNIQPIEIASTQYKSGTNCVLAGWGKTEPHSKPLQLLYKNFTIYNHMKCKLYFLLAKMRVTTQMICAISKYSNACSGDGGSGLVCTDVNGNKNLAGITSIVQERCSPNSPGIFTNVGEYKNWIDNITWNDPEETTIPQETTSIPDFGTGVFPLKYYYILSFTLIAYL